MQWARREYWPPAAAKQPGGTAGVHATEKEYFFARETFERFLRVTAVYLNATDSLGSIGPGKIADLVLLAANPLHDIGSTSEIVAVLVHGGLVPSEERQSMLAAVRQQAEDDYPR